jgi:hypothetical protein
VAIWGTLNSKALIKKQLFQYLAAPFAPPHGTLVFRGTLVGNHWTRHCFDMLKARFEPRKFEQIIYSRTLNQIKFPIPSEQYQVSNLINERKSNLKVEVFLRKKNWSKILFFLLSLRTLFFIWLFLRDFATA